jgi:multisubunit Na+/H+ antiporter MnhF subunit
MQTFQQQPKLLSPKGCCSTEVVLYFFICQFNRCQKILQDQVLLISTIITETLNFVACISQQNYTQLLRDSSIVIYIRISTTNVYKFKNREQKKRAASFI